MVAAAIYGTRWGKNRKEKENKTLHGLSRRWAGQGQPRRAPAAASRATKRCNTRLLFWICAIDPVIPSFFFPRPPFFLSLPVWGKQSLDSGKIPIDLACLVDKRSRRSTCSIPTFQGHPPTVPLPLTFDFFPSFLSFPSMS